MANYGLPVPDQSLFFICRMCTRMADYWSQGQTKCQEKCGGPRKGMAYPRYRGPMTPSYIRNYCFVCGGNADFTASVQEAVNGLELGVCKRHSIFLGIDPEKLDQLPVPEQLGVVEETQIKQISIYDFLDIDPVKDLGFEPEEEGSGSDKE